MRQNHYETRSITRIRYEAAPGANLKVVAEATDLNGGDTSVFEVRLGRIDKFKVYGVEIIARTKKGRNKEAPNKIITWDELRTGDAIVNALNGHGGLVKRVGGF